jgi:endonuclease-3 related protein
MQVGARMASRVEEDSGIDGRRLKMLARRLARGGPGRRWWPYSDPFELAVSAVLTQQTRWSAVERAMEALRREGLLTPAKLARASPRDVERLVRPTGFYRQKARAIQGISRILVDRFQGRIEGALALPTDDLRREVLSWPGVGEETADAILLYGAARPRFVVDAYTYRLMERFGVTRGSERPSYAATSAAWALATAGGLAGFQAAHGAIVDVCKTNCMRQPECRSCRLDAVCPKIGVKIVD